MVWRVDWRAPKSHNAVAHVFVNGAPVAANVISESAENRVEQRLELGGLHGFAHLRKTPHVAKQHRHLFGRGLHAVGSSVFDHFINQFGRHVGAKQVGQLPLGFAFNKIAVAHIEREGCNCRHQRAGQWQHQPIAQIEPEI